MYYSEIVGLRDGPTTVEFANHGNVGTFPPSVLGFFNRLKPATDGVPLVDLKEILRSETDYELRCKVIRIQLHRRGLLVRGGLAYVE